MESVGPDSGARGGGVESFKPPKPALRGGDITAVNIVEALIAAGSLDRRTMDRRITHSKITGDATGVLPPQTVGSHVHWQQRPD